VTVTPLETPTPPPTPTPTPAPEVAATAKPVAAAPEPSAKASAPKTTTVDGPKITGSASCSGGTLHASVTVTGTKLSWFGLYVDTKLVKGGPISGNSYSTSYSKAAAKGDHDVEATAQDAAGHTSRKVLAAHCA
jgi:hypothetical protein